MYDIILSVNGDLEIHIIQKLYASINEEGNTMTETMVSQALSEIALKKKAEQSEIISNIGVNNKNEMKARKIAVNIFDNGYKFVGMKFSDKAFDEAYYAVRMKKVFGCPERVMYFKAYKNLYDKLSDSDKKLFLIYAHAVQSLKMCFEDPKRQELEKAEAYGDSEKIFECKMLLAFVEDLNRAWTEWWNQNGCLSVKELL